MQGIKQGIKAAGLTVVLALITGCPAAKAGKCSSDAQCAEGAYCDTGLEVCIQACEEIGCRVEGHFCDPGTQECVAGCPFGCSASVSNGTAVCDKACSITCKQGFHLCGGNWCASDTDASACGESCTICPEPQPEDPNAQATCSFEQCGQSCKQGYYRTVGACAPCDTIERCGELCSPCSPPTEHGQAMCSIGSCIMVCDPTFHLVGNTCISDATPRFERTVPVKDQPIVRDTTTNLIWQGCTAGRKGDDCTKSDSSSAVGDLPWADAVAYCQTLSWGGFQIGWRLPRQESEDVGGAKELETILDKTRTTVPSIDIAAFPSQYPPRFMWSSTAIKYSEGYAWGLDLEVLNGRVLYRQMTLSYTVRCIHDP